MRQARLRAIALMIAAVAVFSGMDALLKLLSAHYPPMEVTVLRGAASLPFMLLPLLFTGRWRDLRIRRFPMHVLRGLLGVVALGGFIYAVRVLSLANAYAVFLSAPLIVTALSVPLLKEHADARNWAAIFLGLAGVLTMLRPRSPHPTGCRSSACTGAGCSPSGDSARRGRTCSRRLSGPRPPRWWRRSNTARSCGALPSTGWCGTCCPRCGCVWAAAW